MLRNKVLDQEMTKRFWFTRFTRYYNSKGLSTTIRRIVQKFAESLFEKPYILFYADLAGINDAEHSLPKNFNVTSYQNERDVPQKDLEAFFDYLGEKMMRYYLKTRLHRGASLWVVKVDGTPAGYLWSIRGDTIQPHYFPLTENDVNLFDDLIFEKFRGRGINPLFVNEVLCRLKHQSLTRAFIDTNVTNCPEIHSLAKTGFKQFATARKFRLGKRNFTTWLQKA